MVAALFSHFKPCILAPQTPTQEHCLCKRSPALLVRTSTALVKNMFVHPGPRLGGTETLRHHALINTQLPPLMHLLNFVSWIKTSWFLLWIWIPVFTFTAPGEILTLPVTQGRTQAKHVLATGNVAQQATACWWHKCCTNIRNLTVHSKMAVKVSVIHQIEISTSHSAKFVGFFWLYN